jgi:hypothetical protein
VITGTTTTSIVVPRVYAQATTDTGITGSAAPPTLSLDYGTNGKKFEPVNERYIVQSGTLINNDNFKFYSDEWHEVAHGDILQARIDGNPDDMAVKLVKVLNPVERGHQDFKDMRFSNIIITLPLASSYNGQHRNFLVTNDVPSGYYVVNILARFNNQQLAIVYTGKVFIPAAAGSANIESEHSSQSGPGQQARTCGANQTFDRVSGDCVVNRGGGPGTITRGPCAAGQVRTERMSTNYRLERGPCVPIPSSVPCPTGQERNLLDGRCRPPPALSCPPGQVRADLNCVPIPPPNPCPTGQERTLRGCELSSDPCPAGQFRYINGRCLPIPSPNACSAGRQRTIYNNCLSPLSPCPPGSFRYAIECLPPPSTDPCPGGQERFLDGECHAVAGDHNELPQTIGPECTTDPMTGASICNSPAPTTPASSAPSPQDRTGTSGGGGHHRGGGGGGTPIDGGSGTGSPVDDGGGGGGGCKGDKCGGGGGGGSGTPDGGGGGGGGDVNPGGK